MGRCESRCGARSGHDERAVTRRVDERRLQMRLRFAAIRDPLDSLAFNVVSPLCFHTDHLSQVHPGHLRAHLANVDRCGEQRRAEDCGEHHGG